MKYRNTTATLLFLAALLAGCSAPGSHGDEAATVNGVSISRDAWQKVVDGSVRSLELRGIIANDKNADNRRRLRASHVAALRELIREEVYQQIAREKHITVSNAEVDQSIKELEKTVGGHDALAVKLDSAGQTDADLRHLVYVNSLRLKLRQADPQFAADLDKRLRTGDIKAYVDPCGGSDHAWPKCSGENP
ncbi:MAG: hypothetical protein NVSMB17_04840 [Candidatus Dormibacteria bacterium]